jgi:hypothetical protein
MGKIQSSEGEMFFAALKDNPDAFFKFMHDQIGIRLRAEGQWGKWNIEEEIIKSLFDSPKTSETYVRGSNSCGKTFGAGVAGNAYFFCRQPSYVLYLSTKKEQAKAQAWAHFLSIYRQIRRWCKKQKISLPEGLNERIEFNELWWARVYAGHIRGEKDKATGWSGFHNKYQLFVIDESPGLPDNVYEMITGNITSKHNVLLAQGNPLERGNWWFRNQMPRSDTGAVSEHRKVFAVSAMMSPNYLHRVWAEEYKKEHGDYPEDPHIIKRPDGEVEFDDVIPGLASYEWIKRTEEDPETKPGTAYHDGHVRGEFPEQEEWGLIPWTDIQKCAESSHGWQACIEGLGFDTWRSMMESMGKDAAIKAIVDYADRNEHWILLPDWSRVAVGVDVADSGGNLSVITVLAGDKMLEQRVSDGKASVDLPPLIERTLLDYDIWTVGIDKPGVGVGPVAILQDRGIDVLEFKGGTPVNDADERQEYVDLNSEMGWSLRRRFTSGFIEILDDETLKRQCASIKWLYTSGNKVKVPKPSRSPDKFDSLRIAHWAQQFAEYSPSVMDSQLPRYDAQFGRLDDW